MKKKSINISLIIILVASCTMTKINKNTNSLEGQRWLYEKEFAPGTFRGTTWEFLPNNQFIGKSWYSGGVYMENLFSGSYYYDATDRTAFLKYKRYLNLKNVLKYSNGNLNNN